MLVGDPFYELYIGTARALYILIQFCTTGPASTVKQRHQMNDTVNCEIKEEPNAYGLIYILS